MFVCHDLWPSKMRSWDASRGEARQRGGPNIENFARSFPEGENSYENPSQNWPQISQDPFKMQPKSIQKAFWSPSWNKLLRKYVFERPKNGQEAPKRARKRPQMAPNPSQMEPKTLSNLTLKRFFRLFFPTPKQHRIFNQLLMFFGQFCQRRTLKFIDFLKGKRYFLQNRTFQW